MPMEKKDVCLTLENVSKVFARVESDEVTHALQDVRRMRRWVRVVQSS